MNTAAAAPHRGRRPRGKQRRTISKTRQHSRGMRSHKKSCSSASRTYEVHFLELLILQYDVLADRLHLPAMDRDLYETLFLFKLRNYISSSKLHRCVPQSQLRRDTRIGPLIGGLELVLRGLKQHAELTMTVLRGAHHREDIVNRLLSCSEFYEAGHGVQDDAKISFLLLLQEHQRSTVLVMEAMKKWQESFWCTPQVFCWWNGESYMDRLKEDLRALQNSTVGRQLGLRLQAFPCTSHISLPRWTHRTQLMRIAKLVSTHNVMEKGVDPVMCPEVTEYFDMKEGQAAGAHASQQGQEGKKKTKGLVPYPPPPPRSQTQKHPTDALRCRTSPFREDTTGEAHRPTSHRGGRGSGRRRGGEEGENTEPARTGSRGKGVSTSGTPRPRCGAAGQWRRKRGSPSTGEEGEAVTTTAAALNQLPYGAPPSEVAAAVRRHAPSSTPLQSERKTSATPSPRGKGDSTSTGTGPTSPFSSKIPGKAGQTAASRNGGGGGATSSGKEATTSPLRAAELAILTFDDALEASLRWQLELAEEKKVFYPLLHLPLLCVNATVEGVPPGALPLNADMWPELLDVEHCKAFAKAGSTPEALPGCGPNEPQKVTQGAQGGRGGIMGGEEEEEEDDDSEREKHSSDPILEKRTKQPILSSSSRSSGNSSRPISRDSSQPSSGNRVAKKEGDEDGYSDSFNDPEEDRGRGRSASTDNLTAGEDRSSRSPLRKAGKTSRSASSSSDSSSL